MDTWVIVGAGAAAVGIAGLAAWMMRPPDALKAAVAAARESGEVAPIVEAIKARGLADKPNVWHQTLDTLWNDYERELAARLVVEAGVFHSNDMLQSWIQRVIEVEPEIAMETFTRAFVIEKLGLDEEALPKNAFRGPRPEAGKPPKKAAKGKR